MPEVKSHSKLGVRTLYRCRSGTRRFNLVLALAPGHSHAVIAGGAVIRKHKPKVDHSSRQWNWGLSITTGPVSRQAVCTQIN
jgi:hypothetical protein